jgi:hypothetical protein
VAVLLLELESVSFAVTLAELLIVPEVLGVTTIVTVAFAPSPMLPRLQVTVPPDSLHVPWLGMAEPKGTPVGSVSVSTTPVAVSGPMLVTVSVYVNDFPGATGSGESVLDRDKSRHDGKLNVPIRVAQSPGADGMYSFVYQKVH